MFAEAGNMFIPTAIGPYLPNVIHAGLKAGGNIAGAAGYGFRAIGDKLTVLTTWFQACNVYLLQAFFIHIDKAYLSTFN